MCGFFALMVLGLVLKVSCMDLWNISYQVLLSDTVGSQNAFQFLF